MGFNAETRPKNRQKSSQNFILASPEKATNQDKISVPCRAVPRHQYFEGAVPVPWKNLRGFPSLPKITLQRLFLKMTTGDQVIPMFALCLIRFSKI